MLLQIPLGDLRLIGNIGLEGGGDPVGIFASIISSIIGLLTIIAAIYFMFILITGAIAIIGSSGDKASFERARRQITTGIIGLIVAISAMFIMDLITDLLGIQSILDIGAMISNIQI